MEHTESCMSVFMCWIYLLFSVPFGYIILGSHKWCGVVIFGKPGGAVLVSLSPLKFIWHLTVEVLDCRCRVALLFLPVPLKGMCVALVDPWV